MSALLHGPATEDQSAADLYIWRCENIRHLIGISCLLLIYYYKNVREGCNVVLPICRRLRVLSAIGNVRERLNATSQSGTMFTPSRHHRRRTQ
jgi:hypothetical protein